MARVTHTTVTTYSTYTHEARLTHTHVTIYSAYTHVARPHNTNWLDCVKALLCQHNSPTIQEVGSALEDGSEGQMSDQIFSQPFTV